MHRCPLGQRQPDLGIRHLTFAAFAAKLSGDFDREQSVRQAAVGVIHERDDVRYAVHTPVPTPH